MRLPGCFGALGPACPLKAASCAAHHSPSLACGGLLPLPPFLFSPSSPFLAPSFRSSRYKPCFLRFRWRKCFPPASRKVSGCLAAPPCSLGAPEPQHQPDGCCYKDQVSRFPRNLPPTPRTPLLYLLHFPGARSLCSLPISGGDALPVVGSFISPSAV